MASARRSELVTSVGVTEAAATYLNHLSVERGLSTNTVDSYRRDLDRYAAYLAHRGIVDVAAVAPSDVAGFAQYLTSSDAPLAASSVARAVVAVRNFHKFCTTDRLTPTDPAADVHPPQQGKRLPKALTIDEVQRLLDVPDRETVTGLRDTALLELLYGTGARISEIVRLDVDDVSRLIDEPADADLGLRLIGKGDTERVVPLGRYAREALAGWLVRGRPVLAAKGVAGPALLLNVRGRRLSRQSAWAIISDYAQRARLSVDVSPHTLRHSYATHLLDGGADVRVVQELLGHASVTTTQIYTLVSVDHLREVYLTSHPRATTK